MSGARIEYLVELVIRFFQRNYQIHLKNSNFLKIFEWWKNRNFYNDIQGPFRRFTVHCHQDFVPADRYKFAFGTLTSRGIFTALHFRKFTKRILEERKICICWRILWTKEDLLFVPDLWFLTHWDWHNSEYSARKLVMWVETFFGYCRFWFWNLNGVLRMIKSRILLFFRVYVRITWQKIAKMLNL